MITRSKMRRQLYRGGGITRQRYGLGDLVRKLIPNEIADVAVKAAPFVAPFNPGIAGLMRGIGRYDQRGSLSDALKQGLATTALGAGTRYLGGASPMGGGLTGGFTTPMGTQSGFKMGAWGGADAPAQTVVANTRASLMPAHLGETGFKLKDVAPSDQSWWQKALFGKEGGTGKIFGDKGLIGAGGDFSMKEAFGKGLPAIFAGSTLASLAVQKAMGDVGEREPGESLAAFNKRRKGTVSQYLDYYFRRANKFRIAPENMDAAAADFVAQNTKEYVNQGGRVGLYGGGEAGIKSLDAGAPDITYEGNEGPQAPMKMADSFLRNEYDKYVYDLLEQRPEAIPMSFEEFRQMVIAEGKMSGGQPLPQDPTKPINPFAPKPTGPVLPDKMMAAKGGRIGYAGGNYVGSKQNVTLSDEYNSYLKEGGTMSFSNFVKMLREDKAQGGRIGYSHGGQTLFGDIAEIDWGSNLKDLGSSILNMPKEAWEILKDFPTGIKQIYFNLKSEQEKKDMLEILHGDKEKKAQGGRIGQLYGTGPAGLPGIPRQASDGMEFDMRENGGFQGLGAKEGKDDVPAMLAKNEFVFTADAVRGAGGGDIELGAQRMYDTMKNLEKRMA